MKIEITWNDGKREKVEFDLTGFTVEDFKNNLLTKFRDITISVGQGESGLIVYHLMSARKVEILHE